MCCHSVEIRKLRYVIIVSEKGNYGMRVKNVHVAKVL